MRLSSGVRRVGRARAFVRVVARGGVVCLLATGACRSHQAPAPTDVVDLNGDGQRTGQTRLRVDNQQLADMTIYAYENTHRIRLGRARGNSVTSMVIPGSIVSGVTQLRFYAEPMGNARGRISEPIPVSPGDQVDFLIP